MNGSIRRSGKVVGAAVTVLALGVAFSGPAAATDGYSSGRYAVSTSYKFGASPTSSNAHSGYNFYFGAANGTVSGGVNVRWVKCGNSSTQDGASSVGGTAVTIGSNGTIAVALGTNFLRGSCVTSWARALSAVGAGKNFGYEQYFRDVAIP
jgi:hypothetical protein